MFYQSTFLENPIDAHKKYPNAVCANRCVIIEPNEVYADWRSLNTADMEECNDLLPTGCGGVLYQVGSLHEDVLNAPLFTDVCAGADDIWLNCCIYLQGTSFFILGKTNIY